MFVKILMTANMIFCVCPNPSVDMFAWVDGILPGEANRVQREKRFPGGKGVHVALAAAELGEKVQLLAFWGGPTGQWIRNRCEEMGISCHGPEIEGWSRTCITFKSRDPYHDTELLGAGPAIDSKNFENFVSTYRSILAAADCVCLSGSWPQGAPGNAYAQLIRIAKDAETPALLDTTGEQLQYALEEGPTAVHLNRTEVQTFFAENDVRAAAILLAEKCEYALVTSGAEGLYLAHGTAMVHGRCPVEQVYSAVGSGDCLLAGFAVAFTRRLSTEDTARLAVASGTANCIREDLGMLYRSDVDRLLPAVTLSGG